jgi:hypothetical protein
MKISAEGVVFPSVPNSDASSCCFPGICVLDTGRWLAGARLGPLKASRTERVRLRYSDDQGKTWSPLIDPAPSVPVLAGRPGQWRAAYPTPLKGNRALVTLSWEDHSDPFRPMYNEKTEGIVDMRMYTAISEDGGQTWDAPRPVSFGPYDGVPNAITGACVVLPDGRWGAQFEVNKHYDDTTPWQHHSSLIFSSDEGKTWDGCVDTHTDPAKRVFCWDQRMAVLRDGTLQVLYWTFDRQTALYLNIHARASKDSGRTWGPLGDTGVPGQPARPVSLHDGRMLMVYVDRTSSPVIKARISGDNGKSWPDSTEAIIHQPDLKAQTWKKGTMSDAWAEMGAFSLGLPDATALPDGGALVVYYAGPKADQTDVRWARIQI